MVIVGQVTFCSPAQYILEYSAAELEVSS